MSVALSLTPGAIKRIMGQKWWAQGHQRDPHLTLALVTASWDSRGRNYFRHRLISLLHFRDVRRGLTEDTDGPQYPRVPHLQIQPTIFFQYGKYLEKKFQKIPKKQNLTLPHNGNYLHSINIVFTTIYIAFTMYQVLEVI